VSLIINDLLRDAAERYFDAPALLAPGRHPMSHGQLWDHVQQVAGTLHSIGIDPGDCIAVVRPDGPEMAPLGPRRALRWCL
jgi:non-ribosomal peptide synthetase component E (peptide arylation enzyme)